MKRGKELGQAIRTVIDRKIRAGHIKSRSEIARAIGVQPPSLYGWIQTGRIADDTLFKLIKYLDDVSTPADWGLEDWPEKPRRPEMVAQSELESFKSLISLINQLDEAGIELLSNWNKLDVSKKELLLEMSRKL